MKPILIFLFLLSLTSISKGAILKEEPPSLESLLIQAIERGDIEAVNNLIEEGASVYGNYTTRPSTILPLELALKLYNRDKARQRTIPNLASRYEIIDILIRHGGAHLDGQPWSILHRLASGRNIQDMAILLSEGAYVNARDRLGNTPLHKVASSYRLLKLPLRENITESFFEHNKQTAQFLIDKDADINARNNEGDTPLHILIKNTVFLDQEPPFFYRAFARHLLRPPENKSTQLATLLNAMTLAVLDSSFTNLYIHYIASIQFWVENGADIYARNNKGLTPLDLIAQKEYARHYEIITHTLLETKPNNTFIEYYDIVLPYNVRNKESPNNDLCGNDLL